MTDSVGRGMDAHLVVRRGADFTLDVELGIAAGETLALLGPNGAGKSTTVDLLAGRSQLDAGHIDLAGRRLDEPGNDIFVPSEQRRIGVVFQDYLLFDHLNVRENVMFGPRARGQRKAEAMRIADRWIELLDIGRFVDRRPTQLSGGQAQRVALARALASDPDMLLLDEPLAALDIGNRSELRSVLASQLATVAGPRLLITHDPADAFLLADRIAIVEAGRITQCGTGEEIRRRPATAYGAAVAGTNLLMGSSVKGALVLDDYDHTFQAADTSVEGPALITIHTTAIALHLNQPSGSPRNSWHTHVATIEPLGDTTRITLGTPVPLSVDITPGSTAALGLSPGSQVWASVKATEISVAPAVATR